MAESAVNFLLQRLVPIFENEVKLFRGIPEHVVHLKGRLELIRASLKVADEAQESDGELNTWVKQVRDIAHEIEDLLDELELIQRHNHADGFPVSLSKISCCIRNMKARYRIVSELKDLNSRIRTIFPYDTAPHASTSNSSYTGTLKAMTYFTL